MEHLRNEVVSTWSPEAPDSRAACHGMPLLPLPPWSRRYEPDMCKGLQPQGRLLDPSLHAGP